MNNTLEMIMDRRSIRKFTEEPVAQEQLADILEAGRWAPTGGNCQTVHFLVLLNPEVREGLRKRVFDAFSAMELRDDQYASIQNSIRQCRKGSYVFDYHASVLVVVSNRKGYPNAMADSACALQNMMLEAESLGVGSCWINQLHWLDEDLLVREYLESFGLGAEETICGALALGHYEKKPARLPRTGMRVDYIS